MIPLIKLITQGLFIDFVVAAACIVLVLYTVQLLIYFEIETALKFIVCLWLTTLSKQVVVILDTVFTFVTGQCLSFVKTLAGTAQLYMWTPWLAKVHSLYCCSSVSQFRDFTSIVVKLCVINLKWLMKMLLHCFHIFSLSFQTKLIFVNIFIPSTVLTAPVVPSKWPCYPVCGG